MSYKRNAGANRDALFGGGGGGGPSYKSNAAANRDALFGGGGTSSSEGASRPTTTTKGTSGGTARTTTTRSSTASSRPASTSVGGRTGSRVGGGAGVLTGAAKMAKMKEAEEFRVKAKKAMTRGVFSGPDPIAASNYYKRAADAYKACGENRLERLHRIASGDCQMGQDAYATAAGEYMRAAELAAASDEPASRRAKEVYKVYSDAANAWRQQNEPGRAGECMMKAAFGLLIGTEDSEDVLGSSGKVMNMKKNALKAIEEAIEAHVPDIMNKYGNFRQIGPSAYYDPNADDEAKRDATELAKNNMVKTSYAHETVYKACFKLIRYGEYPSALYAAGAATALIGADGFATISLSRAFVTETILALALGDVVAAEKYFLEVHLQKDSYLKSRECKLAEDLIRAVKDMDGDALDESRDANGSNRAALANLDPALRGLVVNLRVSGRVARPTGRKSAATARASPAARAPASSRPKQQGSRQPAPVASGPKAAAAPSAKTAPPPNDMLEGAKLQSSLDANFAELDGLMDDMGLGDESDGEVAGDDNVGIGATIEGGTAAYVEEDDDDDFGVDLR